LTFRIEVPAHPASIGFVRRAVLALHEMSGSVSAELLALVFTELVTNAIRHASLSEDAHIEVCLRIEEGLFRGSVKDDGIGFELSAEGPRPSAEGGFGLVIVERIAKSWGIELRPQGTEVWFEL
jgi:two-component sensor histidine kinase